MIPVGSGGGCRSFRGALSSVVDLYNANLDILFPNLKGFKFMYLGYDVLTLKVFPWVFHSKQYVEDKAALGVLLNLPPRGKGQDVTS
jgi:hypothetical protein